MHKVCQYSLDEYGHMMMDETRMKAFIAALERVITPDSVVLDIGTGTGIFAMLACQMGAKKVYAIEPNDAVILAEQMAAANGYADRIEFIQGVSLEVELPEKVDVVLSDLREKTPLLDYHIPSIIDAKKRFLALDGVLIPQRDKIWVNIIESPANYRENAFAWRSNPYGLDLELAARSLVNTRSRVIESDSVTVLSKPELWATLDYTEIDSPHVSGEVELSVNRTGPAHGYSLWFDCELAEGIEFTNGWDVPERIYGRAFLAFEQEVILQEGDIVRGDISAHLQAGQYLWQWRTRIEREGQVIESFNQSSFAGKIFSMERMKKHAASFIPKLNCQGEVEEFVLRSMDGSTSLQVIADELVKRFPIRFPTQAAALNELGILSEKLSV